MNIKLVGIVAALSGALMACGDSGTGGSGGGTGGSSAGGGDVGGSGGSANGGGNAGGAGGGTGGASCDEQFPDGAIAAATLVITECGCTTGALCETECTGDDACTTPGPETSIPACGDCIQAAADAQDQCALDAAFSPDCTGECSDYVNCVIAAG